MNALNRHLCMFLPHTTNINNEIHGVVSPSEFCKALKYW